MKNVLLYPNPTKANIEFLLNNLIISLEKHNAKIYMFENHRCLFSKNISSVAFLSEEDEKIKKCDLIITIGGDGTILRIAPKAAVYNIPILSVNIGKLGFMTELEPDELKYLDKYFAGEFEYDSRIMLNSGLYRNGTMIYSAIALNDTVITKGDILRTIDIKAYVDNLPIVSFSGDGVIISTPTGSTAYSMSAGGPILDPISKNIVITPICAHIAYVKSIVVPYEKIITIKIEELDQKSAFLSLDGGEIIRLCVGDSIVIEKSLYVTRLIRLKERNFYDILKCKLSYRGDQ